MPFPRPLLCVIFYFVTSSTAQLASEAVCTTNITLMDSHLHITDKILSNLAQPDKNSSLHEDKKALHESYEVRCDNSFFAVYETTEAWIQIAVHGVLGFFFGAASTLAIGFMSAMWWFTTNLASQQEKNEQRKQRLEQIMYRNQQGCLEMEQSRMCPICLEDFPDLEGFPDLADSPDLASSPNLVSTVEWPDRVLPKSEDFAKVLLCGHKFHDVCVSAWLQRNDTCPICRLDHPVQSTPKLGWWESWQRLRCKNCQFR